MEMFIDKYRPQSLDDFVFCSEAVKQLKAIAQNDNVPHMIIHGYPGSGKKTIANLYLAIEQDIKINEIGEVVKEVKITLKNTGKDDKWLNGRYNEWQRVYVPEGSELLDKKYWRDFSLGKQLGKTVFTSYTYVRPIEYSDNTSQIIYTYRLPFKVKKGDVYRLLIQKQPGTFAHEFIIRINGKEKERFLLAKDKTLKFKTKDQL